MKHFGERVKSARKMKGWSLQELADHMSNIVTKQALNKYEAGIMQPSSKILLQLAKVLDVQLDYFIRPPSIELPAVEFRKKAALSAKEIERIKEHVKSFLERYLEVEALLNINCSFINPIQHIQINNEYDVDKAAENLLDKWNVGLDAVPNVIEMLEDKGIKVIEIEATDAFNGLSTFVGEIPVIVLNRLDTVERKRFTALHELGHLVLRIAPHTDKERFCHAFAGAVLLPDDCLESMIGRRRTKIAPGELVSIKEQFGISVQAIMMRAIHKGIIDQRAAQRFWQSIAKNKMEIGLGAYTGKEKSYRFEHLVFRLAAEDVVSMSRAANLAGMKLAAFREKLETFETA